MNKTIIYKDVKYDELRQLDLNLNSILVMKSDEIDASMIKNLRDGLSHLSFRVPIIGLGEGSTLEDVPVDQVIDFIVNVAQERNDIKERLLRALK